MSCAAQSLASAPRIPIRVNGVAIPHAEISREAQHHPAERPADAWQAAALALVVREALLQEARRSGIAAEPAVNADGRRETPDEALIRALVERDVAVPDPTEEECRRYYDGNRRHFRSSDLHMAAHILLPVPPDDEAARAAARADAEAIIALLGREPQRFAELAASRSACPSAAQGGALGQIARGQTVPEFEAALSAIRPGEIGSRPVETRYGIHVVRVERRIPGRALPFEAVRDRIAAYLRASVERRARAQYVARLLAASAVEGIELPLDRHNVH